MNLGSVGGEGLDHPHIPEPSALGRSLLGLRHREGTGDSPGPPPVPSPTPQASSEKIWRAAKLLFAHLSSSRPGLIRDHKHHLRHHRCVGGSGGLWGGSGGAVLTPCAPTPTPGSAARGRIWWIGC